MEHVIRLVYSEPEGDHRIKIREQGGLKVKWTGKLSGKHVLTSMTKMMIEKVKIV